MATFFTTSNAFFLLTWSRCLAIFVSLDGQDWTVTNGNKSISVYAKVPGGIYSDLNRNKILGDLLRKDSEEKYRWVAYDTWTYQKSFSVPSEVVSKSGIFLIAHGLDTVADIYLNDRLVGHSNNMFVRYKFDIKQFLNSELNVIKIKFRSPVLYAKQKSDERQGQYVIPPICPHSVQRGECHVNYIRKMQCSFSWDWGPAFPSVGIWKSIGIEAYDYAIIRDLMVQTLRDKDDKWKLNTTVVTETANVQPFNGKLNIYLNNVLQFSTKVTINSKQIKHNFQINVNTTTKIKLWWPNGFGVLTPQGFKEFGRTLYQIKAEITPERQQHSTFSKTVRIGFRTIELIQQPLTNDSSSLSFFFVINRVPIFMKGSNWIPADIFPERTTKEYLRKLLMSAKEANINMLRVWGGGVYESDDFYDLADEMGILIWQDFMFAVALYPTDNAFLDTVKVEVEQQVRRLYSHPSVAIWAGNNENEEAIAALWWPQVEDALKELKSDYLKLYINTIRQIVIREDTSRVYLSSSPSNGLETEKEGWLSSFPQNPKYGDVHYYNYEADSWKWQNYPSAKFVSEYGFQAFPSLHTMFQAFPIEDMTFPLSPSVEKRQHLTSGSSILKSLISTHLKLPASGSVDRFRDFIYLSQISQAMSIKTETEFYRRNRRGKRSGLGLTMGALYWQLNDVWQAPTWSSIEFGGKWKMLHYFAKNMFSQIHFSPFIYNDKVNVVFINDAMLSSKVEMQITVYKLHSFVPAFTEKRYAECNGLSTNQVYSKSLNELLQQSNCSSTQECLMRVNYSTVDKTLNGDNFLLFASPRDFKGLYKCVLNINNVTLEDRKTDDQFVYELQLTANTLCAFVWLDFKLDSNIDGIFSDNGFFVYQPLVTLKFKSQTKYPSNYVKENIVTFSLTDVVTNN